MMGNVEMEKKKKDVLELDKLQEGSSITKTYIQIVANKIYAN